MATPRRINFDLRKPLTRRFARHVLRDRAFCSFKAQPFDAATFRPNVLPPEPFENSVTNGLLKKH